MTRQPMDEGEITKTLLDLLARCDRLAFVNTQILTRLDTVEHMLRNGARIEARPALYVCECKCLADQHDTKHPYPCLTCSDCESYRPRIVKKEQW